MADLISTLHSLSGNTLGEMLHSLNKVIKNQSKDIVENMDYILENYNPKNDLEKVVKVKLIDHTKCYNEVLNVFKSENNFYVSQALQCSWFFRESNVDSQYLVESIFPQMSLSTRMKVLKKYSKLLKDSFFAESLFNRVRKRYGLRVAMFLLPACSEDFIKNVLKAVAIKLPVCVILPIFDLYPSIVISYFTNLLERIKKGHQAYKKFNMEVYDRIFTLIASKEPSVFAMFIEKYYFAIPHLKLGKRALRRFVKTSYESIKNNVAEYVRLVKWKYVTSNLTYNQLAELQLSLMPKSLYDFGMSCHGTTGFVFITSGLKRAVRQNMLMSSYEKKYGQPITHNMDDLPLSVVKLLPDVVCEIWIEQKLVGIRDSYLHGEYLMYLPIDKAIPRFKAMIEGETDVHIRKYYVSCMFKTTLKRGKYDYIGSLCDYIIKLFHNDAPVTKEVVFQELLFQDKLINVPLESWMSIELLYDTVLLHNESKNCLDLIIKVISVQIHSRLLNGLPVDSHLEKIQRNCGVDYKYDCCSKTPFHRQCLLWFIENFPYKTVKNNEECIRFVHLFLRLCEWNSKNFDNIIEIPEWVWKKIELVLSTIDYNLREKIYAAIRKDKSMKCAFYEFLFPSFADPLILLYKLNREPKTVASRSNDVLKCLLNAEITFYRAFFRRARLYSKFNIPELFCTYCINVIQTKMANFESKSILNAMFVLSIMLPTNKFLEIISKYYPEKYIADVYTDEERELFQIQIGIAIYLKNVDSPSKILESGLKFAKGDYLRASVSSLNSLFLQLPESIILPLLNEKLVSSTSLRKHIIRAYFNISPINKTLETIVRLFEKEKNGTVRFVLFINCLRFFHTDPTPETFNTLKILVGNFNSKDAQCINQIFSMEGISDEFISEYLQLLWNLVSEKNMEVLVNKNKNDILQLVSDDVLVVLKEDFCEILLKHAFEHIAPYMDFKLFAIRYLLFSINKEQLDGRVEKLMVELDKYFNNWNDFDLRATCTFTSRNIISYIIISLVRDSFYYKNYTLQPIDVIMKFKSALLLRIKEEDLMLEDILILEMSNAFHPDPKSSDVYIRLSEFIETYLDKSILIHNVSIIEFFVGAINKILLWIPTREQNFLRVNLVEVLLAKPSEHCHLLALKLIPPALSHNTSRYFHILKKCLNTSNVTMKLHINKLLTSLTDPRLSHSQIQFSKGFSMSD